jgi:hypothetical protein
MIMVCFVSHETNGVGDGYGNCEILFDMKQVLKNWRYLWVIEQSLSLKASPMFCEFYL